MEFLRSLFRRRFAGKPVVVSQTVGLFLITRMRHRVSIECFHMTSRRPYWCPKTMKRRPCWCPKPTLWELNSFLMQTLSFVPINLHRCWPREWKHSIAVLGFFPCGIAVILISTGHIAVSSRSAVCGFSSFWLTVFGERRFFTALRYRLCALSFRCN